MSLIYSRLQLKPNYHYMLYIGEVKSYGVAVYMCKTLEKFKRIPHDVIFVVPDVLEKYPDYMENVIVINPLVYDLFMKNLDVGICRRISARIALDEFYEAVSRERIIVDLIMELLSGQQELFVYTFESRPSLRLPPFDGIKFIGADPVVADRWNDKFFQYEKLSNVVPVPDYIITNRVTDSLLDMVCSEWGKVFVTRRYSAAGSNSAIISSPNYFGRIFENMEDVFMLTRYIPHVYDPTVLGIVASEKDVFIVGVADQTIEEGNRFVGSMYPSSLPKEVINSLRDYTQRVGRILAVEGYRGFFGCDYIINEEGDIYFVEVNARKQGTTMEFCCTFDVEFEDGGFKVTLTDMEFMSILYGTFPVGYEALLKINPVEREDIINWGTYNYKLDVNTRLEGYPVDPKEEVCELDLFKRGDGYIITDYVGDGFTVRRGTFIGRVIAVSDSRDKVKSYIDEGKERLSSCIIKSIRRD